LTSQVYSDYIEPVLLVSGAWEGASFFSKHLFIFRRIKHKTQELHWWAPLSVENCKN